MSFLNEIGKLFGHDSDAWKDRVDQAYDARQNAYDDALKIEAASDMMLGQIPYIERQASYLASQAAGITKAANQALQIGKQNQANILEETAEWARRRGGQQRSEQAVNRAYAAASGIRIDTGGSSDIFRASVKKQHTAEIDWGNKAGESQGNIALLEGQRAQQEGLAMAEGVMAQSEGILGAIPALQSQALMYDAEAGKLRTSGDTLLADTKSARSSSRSNMGFNVLTTALAVATGGAAAGIWGPAASGSTVAFGMTAGQLTLAGTAAVLGAAALSGSSSGSDSGKAYDSIASASTPKFNSGQVQQVQSRALDTTALPTPTANAQLAALPEGATATSKRQYAAQTETKAGAIGGFNPLSTA